MEPDVISVDEKSSALDRGVDGGSARQSGTSDGEEITMMVVTHEMGFAGVASDGF